MFTDWLDLMLYALQRDDDRYLTIVEQYPNERPDGERAIDHFTRASARLQQGMAATDADLLGVIYETYSMQNERFGQYFTPHNLCDAMAAMTVDTADEQDAREEPFTVADPACGSGRMLVAAMQYKPRAVFYGQDKDMTCVKMAALNLCFFNADGCVVHGDSLALEHRRTYVTHATPLGGTIREVDGDELPDGVVESLEDAAQQQTLPQYTEEEAR